MGFRRVKVRPFACPGLSSTRSRCIYLRHTQAKSRTIANHTEPKREDKPCFVIRAPAARRCPPLCAVRSCDAISLASYDGHDFPACSDLLRSIKRTYWQLDKHCVTQLSANECL